MSPINPLVKPRVVEQAVVCSVSATWHAPKHASWYVPRYVPPYAPRHASRYATRYAPRYAPRLAASPKPALLPLFAGCASPARTLGVFRTRTSRSRIFLLGYSFNGILHGAVAMYRQLLRTVVAGVSSFTVRSGPARHGTAWPGTLASHMLAFNYPSVSLIYILERVEWISSSLG